MEANGCLYRILSLATSLVSNIKLFFANNNYISEQLEFIIKTRRLLSRHV